MTYNVFDGTLNLALSIYSALDVAVILTFQFSASKPVH